MQYLSGEMDDMLTCDIGGRLRRARELKGWSLADAARRTKLSVNTLQAIERNDFETLPGGMFRKAYVRTLATEVGLNANELVADYCAQFEPRVETPVITEPDAALQELTPRPQRSLWTFATVAAPAVAWFMLQPGPVGATAPLGPVAPEPAVMMSPYASVAFNPDSDRAPVPAANTADATASPLQLEMTATEACWVAADTDGERVLYRLVEPGERVQLQAHNRIVLRLGNAGAMTLSINGGPGRSFGAVGQIVNLDITPGNVRSFVKHVDQQVQLN